MTERKRIRFGEWYRVVKFANQDCNNGDPKKYTCFWIGFIGSKIPKIKAKLLYENYTI